MKKLLIALFILATTHAYGELPKGDVTLIQATEAGSRGIEFRHAKIEEKEGKVFITFPHIGTAELTINREGDEFYALFSRTKVMHEGTEYESLSVTVFRGYINDEGEVFCSLTMMQPTGANPDEEDYLLKPGIIK